MALKTSETHPISVDFLESNDYPVLNRLGMTFAPGKREQYGIGGHWHRELANDLERLRNHYEVQTLVSLVEDEELDLLGIPDLQEECKRQKIVLVRFPIKDLSTPASLEEFSQLLGLIGDRINKDSTVALHCRAGLGRTGLTAACAIVAISEGRIDGSHAVEMVRSARPGTIETNEQERFVLGFGDRLGSVHN